LAGPGTNKHNPVIPGSERDVQKAAPAGPNSGGYRNKAVAVGPQSSHVEYESTKDSGINMPVSGNGGQDFFGQ